MKKNIILILLLLITHTTFAQSKNTISSIGATLDTTFTASNQVSEIQLHVIFYMNNLEHANSVSIGIGKLASKVDGTAAVFTVVKEGAAYYLADQQKRRFKIENGLGNVFMPLSAKPGEYLGKYVIVQCSDKESHSSIPQAAVIR